MAMRITSWAGLRRFLIVINLFISIFWSFYSLKYKRWWHRRAWIETKRQKLYVSEAQRFRSTAIELGGLLIKLGQFFSTRVDILPQETVHELAGLQDEVEPVSFKNISMVAESEFTRPLGEIYAEVDEMPLASASLGQVHRGILTGGQMVAIKILRPNIENLIRIDLISIGKVINLLKLITDWERYVDFDAIYLEFSETLQAELDYIQEGHNAETIAQNALDDDQLLIPSIYWDYTTRRVLTMEYMEGIKITDYASLAEAGVNRPAVASKLVNVYVKQVLVDGFFHADPHPGNLFVKEDGRLIMVDFGMVGSISGPLRDILVELSVALVKRDYYQVVGYLKRIGFLRYDADNELVTRAVSILVEEALGTGQDLSSADLSGLLVDLEQLLYEQPFQIPAKFTFLGRALGTLYGLCIGLDPNISFLDEAKPYLENVAKDDGGLWKIAKEKATLLGSSLLEIPPLAERVLRRLERGELSLKVPLTGLNEAIGANTRAVNLLSWALLLGFSFLAAAYLLVNNHPAEARYAIYGSGIIFLLMLRQSRFKGRQRMKAPHPPMVLRRGRDS